MRWEKGQSGNPKGRVKDAVELKYLTQVHSQEAIDRLVHWMRDKNPKASVAACSILLDRGYGKPEQSIEISKVDPFKSITADDVARLRDNLARLGRNREMVTIDQSRTEAAETGIVQTLSETESLS